jgi:hypothetical protein
MWLAKAAARKARLVLTRQRRFLAMQEKFYWSGDQRDTAVTISISTHVGTTDPRETSGGSGARALLRYLPVWNVVVDVGVTYTREALRYMWFLANEEEKEAYGTLFTDPDDKITYVLSTCARESDGDSGTHKARSCTYKRVCDMRWKQRAWCTIREGYGVGPVLGKVGRMVALFSGARV